MLKKASVLCIAFALNGCGNNTVDANQTPEQQEQQEAVQSGEGPSGVTAPAAMLIRFPEGMNEADAMANVEAVALDDSQELTDSTVAFAFTHGAGVALSDELDTDSSSGQYHYHRRWTWGRTWWRGYRPFWRWGSHRYRYYRPYYYRYGGYRYCYYRYGYWR